MYLKYHKSLLIVILMLNCSAAWAFLDLNIYEQTFVLDAKQIFIPQYPDAFNPSIIKINGRFLMSFRSRNPKTGRATLVGMIWLDKNFAPLGAPQILQIEKGKDPSFYIQDPRLVEIEGKLYMVFSDLWKNEESEKRRMCIGEIEYDGIRFLLKNRKFLLNFDGEKDNKFEKNWVPFEYDNHLLLAYSLSPHKVFYPIFEKNKCTTVGFSRGNNYWNWGKLRGGTPGLLIGKYYLSFFHSSTLLTTVQSDEKPMMHYFIGAYLFDKDPPFAIKKISPKPIVKKEFYEGPMYNTWKPLRVVFPGGFVYDEKSIWVFYGRQDHEIWVVKLDKKGLLESLIPSNQTD